jgi:hypothetical protein
MNKRCLSCKNEIEKYITYQCNKFAQIIWWRHNYGKIGEMQIFLFYA